MAIPKVEIEKEIKINKWKVGEEVEKSISIIFFRSIPLYRNFLLLCYFFWEANNWRM
jgi:hypothetical protein